MWQKPWAYLILDKYTLIEAVFQIFLNSSGLSFSLNDVNTSIFKNDKMIFKSHSGGEEYLIG